MIRPTFEQLALIKTLVAEGKSRRDVATAIGCSRKTVVRLVEQHNLGTWAIEQHNLKPIPEGFVEQWVNHPIIELCAIFGASSNTVQRWVTQLGLKRAPGRNVRPAPKPQPIERQPAAKRPVRVINRVTAPIDRPHRDITTAGLAADYLRRFGPVTRCNEAGRFDPNGAFWSRSGSSPLTAEEIIARARRNGWNPDEWQQVAA